MTHDQARWATLTTFASGIEADVARQTLEGAEIPALVRGDHVGIFGAGYQGTLASGVELLVPDVALDRARALLGLAVDA